MTLLSTNQAAEILGIGVRAFNNLVRQKYLEPVHQDSKWNDTRFYHEEDVMFILELREKKVDLPTVASMANQAMVKSRQLERLVKNLLHIVGADIPVLELERGKVEELYLKVEDAINKIEPFEPEEVLEWARIFYAVGEEYLHHIEFIIEDKEPWRKLMALASKISDETPTEQIKYDRILESIYKYFEVSRRNLRNTSYFYIRHRVGQRAAKKEFPVVEGDITEEVIQYAFISSKM